jgi:Zn-finger nucleic acid-binding protein
MKCPKCGHDMAEEELEGVRVDRCSFCEGVFLDAGELDQVMLKRESERRGFFRRLVGA